MPEGNGKPETDPEAVARMLEIELMQKRAGWQQTNARRKNLRLLSFSFLFLIVAGSFVAFYFLFSSDTLDELKSRRPTPAEVSPSPTETPR